MCRLAGGGTTFTEGHPMEHARQKVAGNALVDEAGLQNSFKIVFCAG